MSSIQIYDVSVGLMIKGLTTLRHILQKATESPDAASFPDAKLFDDMRPLSFQIQVASNTAKKTVSRFTGVEGEVWEDNETTMPELIARVDKTLELLKGVDPKSLEGKESANVELSLGKWGTRELTGKDYSLGYGIPNFFFHVNTAYAILRMKGVPLGKGDYLTSFLS